MRLALLGTGEFAVPALRELVRAGHVITVAISQPDRPAGRGRTVQPTPVHAAAAELGVRHVQTEDINSLDVAELCAGSDLGVVVAFGQKLGSPVLRAFRLGCVNIHGSLLPKYRGAAPYQWAIINGEAVTGVTVFQVNERFDAGAIWSQAQTPIGPTETADELHDRLARLGAELLVATLPDIESGRLQPRPQDQAVATRAPKLTRADSIIDWTQPATRIVRRIHGLWSWPAATCVLVPRRGKPERVLLARAMVADETAAPSAQTVPGVFCDDLTIQTGAGRIRLLEIKPAGGRLMSFADFTRGRHLAPADRLLAPDNP